MKIQPGQLRKDATCGCGLYLVIECSTMDLFDTDFHEWTVITLCNQAIRKWLGYELKRDGAISE